MVDNVSVVVSGGMFPCLTMHDQLVAFIFCHDRRSDAFLWIESGKMFVTKNEV